MKEAVIMENKSGVSCVEKTTAMSVFHQEMPCFFIPLLIIQAKVYIKFKKFGEQTVSNISK